ncbi:hypothetical protein ARMSODRAFT_961375 [Armillaria solidipes]|uniref:F-box domain-containing protein n=1 Tax=Armillaria solidipes TaxID=1076256 RepID=A0A2H3BKI4_9AGAR|nr:hypothetical protein ARMSODRAFT_961375 [Armillaria solidipes]
MQSSGVFLDSLVARYEWLLTFAHPPLLSTNHPPSFTQSAQLKASMERFNATLPELQGELDTLRKAVTSLEAQMSHLLSLKRECETILSPIRRLPPETLMEILRCTRTMDVRYSDTRRHIHGFGFNVFVAERGPWYLGHVCSSWRDTVENLCPELWSTMTVELPLIKGTYSRVMKRNMVALLERVLKRTRGHQLDFFFKYRSFGLSQDDKVMDRCFDLMLAHSSRWRRVELVLSPPLLSRMSVIYGKVDCLEEIYLCCSGDPNQENVNAFAIAPRLKFLHLEGMHQKAEISFSTTNLVSFFDGSPFFGHDLTPRYLHDIASAPNLLSFSWHHHSHIPVSSPPYYPLVTHPTLKELSASSGKLLRSLRLPALTQMALRSGHQVFDRVPVKCPPDALLELHDLLVRSQCSLTILSLVDAGINEHLLAIIALCPHLRNLSIEFNEWTGEADPIMTTLVHQMSEIRAAEGMYWHVLVPCLKRLKIKLTSVDEVHFSFIDRQFVEMIALRVGSDSHNSSPLQWLTLSIMGGQWDWDLDAADLKELNALDGDRGFHFTILFDGAADDEDTDADTTESSDSD